MPVSHYISQLYVVPAVDAVDAGKGQLEISVNQGRVPNNVQMQVSRDLAGPGFNKSGDYREPEDAWSRSSRSNRALT